jgi:WD40 repeat protein
MGGAEKRGIATLVAGLHILLGCLFLAIGTTLRVPRGGLVFLVFGAWLAIVGIGIAGRKTWAWWSAVIFHPLLVLGEAVVLFVSFFMIGSAWKAEGLGKLGAFVLAAAFLVALVMAFLSVLTWLWLRKPDVREIYFRSDPAAPGSAPRSSTTGLAPAVMGILALAGVLFAYRGYGKPPQPPANRRASRPGLPQSLEVVPQSREATEKRAEPCTPRGGYWNSTGSQFTPDGSRLIARGFDGAICVWEVATGGLDKALDAGKRSSAAWVRGVDEVAISPDGRLLAATQRAKDGSGEIGIWDLAGGTRSSTIPTGSQTVMILIGFGETSSSLIALPDRHTVSVFDTATGAVRATWSAAPTDTIGPVVLSPDRKTLAYGVNRRGPVRIMDVSQGLTRSVDLAPTRTAVAAAANRPGSDNLLRIGSMLFSRDGKSLYMGRFHAVSVVDVASGSERPMLSLPAGARSGDLEPRSVSPDGARLLTEMSGFLFPIFDLTTGTLLTEGSPRVSMTRVEVPIFIEGRLGRSGSWGRVVLDGREAYVALLARGNIPVPGNTRQFSSFVRAGATSPDGSLMALKFDAINNLTLWDAKTDGWLDLLESSVAYGPNVHMDFSQDGRTLAVNEKGIDVWDIPKRKLLYRVPAS